MGLRGRRIAIVGGGVGGLATAAAAGKAGAAVTVFERAGMIGESGAGIQISPNGTRVLGALGLDGGGELPACRAHTLTLRDFADGRVLARLPVAGPVAAPYLLVRRSDLILFLANAARDAGTEFHLGDAAVLRETRGAFDVMAGEGPARSFDVIVAADGLNSGVRRTFLGGSILARSGQRAWRASVSGDAIPADLRADIDAGPCLFVGPGGHVVAYRLPGNGTVNVVAVSGSGAAEPDRSDDRDTSFGVFEGWHAGVTAILSEARDPWSSDLRVHPVLPSWSRGNLVLLGDAAHPMLPHLAQGASAALEDAWTLAAMLCRHGTHARALRAYERLRKPRATRLQRASAANGRFYQLRQPMLRTAAHAVLAVAQRLFPGAVRWRYRWVHDHDATELRDVRL